MLSAKTGLRLTLLSMLCSSAAIAGSLTVTGSVVTHKPSANFEGGNPSSILSFVEPIEFSAGHFSTFCEITNNETVAKTQPITDEGVPRCLFRYVNLPTGVSAGQDSDLQGYLPETGSNTIQYEYVFFSGSANTPITINAGSTIIEGEQPEAPVIVSARSQWSGQWKDGFSPINYRKHEQIEAVELTVQTREYPQIIELKKYDNVVAQCSVPAGLQGCNLDIPDAYVGNGNSPKQGSIDFHFEVNSANNYFNPTQNEFSVNWDYRPPVIADQKYKAVVKDEAVQVVIGNNIDIENDTYVVELKSPHADHMNSDKGHQVKYATLTLTPDPNNSKTSALYEQGVMLFQDPTLNHEGEATPVVMDAVSIEERDGNYYATFNLARVQNGVYEPSVVAGDMNGNDATPKVGDDASLTRTYPSIRAFSNLERVRSGHDVYFFEHVSLATHNGYANQSEITSIFVNGESVYDSQVIDSEHDADESLNHEKYGSRNNKAVVYLNEYLQQEYPTNTEIRIEVTAIDRSGTSADEVFVFDYMPMTYQFTNAPDSVYQGIQMLEISVEQNTGERCEIYADDALAREAATGGEYTCVFQWEALPWGIEPNVELYYPQAHGTTELEGDFPIQASIHMFDANGNKALAWKHTQTMTSLPIVSPNITLDESTMVNGAYPIYVDGGNVVTAEVEAVNSDMEIELIDPTKESPAVLNIEQRNFGESLVTTKYDVESSEGLLWGNRNYQMTAKYELEPDHKAIQEIKTFFVPSKKIKARLEVLDKQAISTIDMNAKITIGQYNSRERTNEYNPATMGEWQAAVVTEDENGELVVLSDWSNINSAGEANLTIDLDRAIDVSLNMYGVAKLKSPVEGYERILETQDYNYRIIKGSEIQGGLKYRTITAIPPFSASFRHVAETRDDLRSRGDITWEISSDDGTTWNVAQEASRSASFVHRVEAEEIGEWLVRARVKNTYTNKEIVTEHVKITSYNKPKVSIEAATQALTGQNVAFKAIDENGLLSETDVFQWSLDKGETWIDGDQEFIINDVQESLQIYTRVQYASVGENAKEVAWGLGKHRLTVNEPREPRLSARIPRLMEVGFKYKLEAIGRKPFNGMSQDLIYEWKLPNGETVSDPVFEFIPAETDVIDGKVEFGLSVWIDGYKTATKREKQINIRTWKYEFPEHELQTVQRQLYAPSEVMMVLKAPRVYAPGVKFEYLFDFSEENIEFIYEVNGRTKVKLLEPGIHRIDVTVTDNRGNIQEITQFLEALKMEPIEVEGREILSNSFDREPLDVSLRLSTRLTHPKDRILDYKWFLNGEQLSEDGSRKYRWLFEELQEGTHEIKGQVITEFGQVGEFVKTITVKDNTPPTCTHSSAEYSSYTRITLNCNDTDGKVQSYKWFVNGEEMGIWTRSIALSYEDEDFTISAEAYDDSGEKVVISGITIYARSE